MASLVSMELHWEAREGPEEEGRSSLLCLLQYQSPYSLKTHGLTVLVRFRDDHPWAYLGLSLVHLPSSSIMDLIYKLKLIISCRHGI